MRRAIPALLAVLALAGCGGGGELAGVDSGGTGSFAVGTISGFGSLVVNDIRYDDRAATVQDAYGTVRTRAELRLGMVVEVEGSALTAAPAGSLHEREGVASEIRISVVTRADTLNDALRVVHTAFGLDAEVDAVVHGGTGR